MTPEEKASAIVRSMLAKDAFSQWLGIELLYVKPGEAAVQMTVRPEMANGFGICHGGVTYSVADSALAFAANTHGTITVSIENSMSYLAAVRAGDTLTATAREERASNRIAFYTVRVCNQSSEQVGIFRGTVYRTKKDFFEEAGSV